MAAVAAPRAHIKSQGPVALEKRLKRLRTNPDYLLLCHAKDKGIAELEEDNKTIDLYKKHIDQSHGNARRRIPRSHTGNAKV
jgi:hypothetical protein